MWMWFALVFICKLIALLALTFDYEKCKPVTNLAIVKPQEIIDVILNLNTFYDC